MSNLDEIDPEDEARTYRAKSFGKRMPVVLAGPVMNLLLGFLLLLVVVVGFGTQSDGNWNVKAVSEGSAAAAAGLQAGDRVTAFDGQPIEEWDEFVSLAQAHAGTTADLTVDRDGQTLEVPVTIGWQLTEASAGQLGLQQGDRVTAVDGEPVVLYADLVGALENADGPVVIDYSRIEADGTVQGTTEVTGPLTLVADGSKGQVGITRELVAEKAVGGRRRAGRRLGVRQHRRRLGAGHGPAVLAHRARQPLPPGHDRHRRRRQLDLGLQLGRPPRRRRAARARAPRRRRPTPTGRCRSSAS